MGAEPIPHLPGMDIDTADRQWFHSVTINVKGKKAKVSKLPFFLKDEVRHFSDTAGGYYYYSGEVNYDREDKTFKIFSSLDSCNYCPRMATATPLYTYETYYIRKSGGNWIVNTNHGEGLRFEKQ